jgi:hypothetical protein
VLVEGSQRACDGGDMKGCTNLGLFYETGRGGLPKSAVRAMTLQQRACDAGNTRGCASVPPSRRLR